VPDVTPASTAIRPTSTQGGEVTKRATTLIAGLLVMGMVATACSEEETTTTTAAPATTAAPTETTAAPTETTAAPTETTAAPTETTAAPGEDLVQWALDYTGGTAGEASGDPIKIGYANSEDFFPENTVGLNAAIAFINAELGGAGGRPLELVPCKIIAAEDGAKCGTELANDPEIALVVTGTILVGNAELYAALNGKKPVIVGNGVAADDFSTPVGQSFTAGSPGVIVGMGGFVASGLPEKPASVAILAQNNAAGQAAADLLFKPVMDKNGIGYTYVGIDDTATAAQVQAALEAVGADEADVLVPLITVQQCINIYDAIKALGINPTVVTTGLCFGTPMTDHLTEVGEAGPVPDGWYFGGYGYSYFDPDYESGMATYVAKIQEYGVPAPGASTLEYTGFAGPSFANMMTIAKFINELGADSLDFASLDGKIRSFTGPMMIQVGPLNCGKLVILGLPIFITPCAAQIGIQQYLDGEWISTADGLNGKPIDVTTI
jgi:branched-chain amino acid transport system substrate-binding protein